MRYIVNINMSEKLSGNYAMLWNLDIGLDNISTENTKRDTKIWVFGKWLHHNNNKLVFSETVSDFIYLLWHFYILIYRIQKRVNKSNAIIYLQIGY